MEVVRRRQALNKLAVDLHDNSGQPIPIVGNFLKHLAARDFSPNTLLAYAHDLKHLFLFLEGEKLKFGDFSPSRSIDFLLYLRGQPGKNGQGSLSAVTVNRIMASLSTFFEYCLLTEAVPFAENPIQKRPDPNLGRVLNRYIPFLSITKGHQPIRRVLRVRTVQRLPRPLNDDQILSLFNSLKKRRDRAMFLLMLQGGLRPGEVLSLHLEDIQYGKKRVAIRHRTDHPRGVRGKSRTERFVDLLEPETLRAVSDYVMYERPQHAESRLLFLVGGRGKSRTIPLSYAALVKLFKRHCLAVGITEAWVTPHALRHTHATRMWEGGMRELTLQKRLGHASLESTRQYTRVSDLEMLKDYQKVLDDKGTK